MSDRSGAPIDARVLATLSAALHHRGPDGRGCLQWSGNEPPLVLAEPRPGYPCRLGLVHRRLAILDLSDAGRQPMSSADGRYFLVFNGEIYNHLELRQELADLGYPFRSRSDTEVVLAAYAHWGTRALNRLVGMFAFAILDTRDNQVLLVRDFFGIKPLYYTCGEDVFAFASEIKALLELPGVSRRANPQRVYDFLRLGVSDHGAETMFADVRQLPAAHYLCVLLANPAAARPTRYWQVDGEPRSDLSFQAAAGRLQELFLDSVALHLRSDMAVGAALSGGIDSSSIVMAVRRLQPDLEIHAFSYIADDPDLSEEAWIDQVAQAAAVRSHKLRVTPFDMLAEVDQLVLSQDEPFFSTTFFAQRRVFHLARAAGIKVVLEGQGADELLGGYHRFRVARLASLLRQGQWREARRFWLQLAATPGVVGSELRAALGALLLPASLRPLARKLAGRDREPAWLNGTWLADRGVRWHSFPATGDREVMREQLYRTLTETYLPMLLRYGDRNAMACSVENRVPFLTPVLVNFVLSLPESYIIAADGTSKAIFREAMKGIVPAAILARRDKLGFDTPARAWLHALAPWVDRVLQCDAASAIPAIDARAMQAEWQAVKRDQASYDNRLWRWLSFILWVQRFEVSF